MKTAAWTSAGWIDSLARLHRQPQELCSLENAMRVALDLGVEHVIVTSDPDLIEAMRKPSGGGIPHRTVLALVIVEGLPAVRQDDAPEDTDVAPIAPTEPPGAA